MADYASLRLDESNPIFKLSVPEFRAEMTRRGYSLGEMERLRKIRRKIKNRKYKQEASDFTII